jgi:hypothetical protein
MQTRLRNLATGVRFIALVLMMFGFFYWLYFPIEAASMTLAAGILVLAISFVFDLIAILLYAKRKE